MAILQEFKKFAMRGNVIDLAVGVVIGAAFGKIVSALVDKVIMPLLGLMMGSVDFSNLGVTLRQASGDTPPLVMNYGAFLQATFDFILVAFAIFMVVKVVNRLRHHEENQPAPPPAPTAEEKLLAEIRDLLKAQGGRA